MAKYANLSADEIRGHRMLVFRRTVAYIAVSYTHLTLPTILRV